jgi:alkylhydroperoxidase family enzyme
MDIGSAVGRALGITEEQLRELATFEASEAFDPLEKHVLRLTEQMSRTPVEIDLDNFEALKRLLTDGALVEVVATIAWENYRARFNRAFDISVQGFSEGAFCVLPERPPLPG